MNHQKIVSELAFKYVLNDNCQLTYDNFFDFICDRTEFRYCIPSYIACRYAESKRSGDKVMWEYLNIINYGELSGDYIPHVTKAIQSWEKIEHLSDHIDGVMERFRIWSKHKTGHEKNDKCDLFGCVYEPCVYEPCDSRSESDHFIVDCSDFSRNSTRNYIFPK